MRKYTWRVNTVPGLKSDLKVLLLLKKLLCCELYGKRRTPPYLCEKLRLSDRYIETKILANDNDKYLKQSDHVEDS